MILYIYWFFSARLKHTSNMCFIIFSFFSGLPDNLSSVDDDFALSAPPNDQTVEPIVGM